YFLIAQGSTVRTWYCTWRRVGTPKMYCACRLHVNAHILPLSLAAGGTKGRGRTTYVHLFQCGYLDGAREEQPNQDGGCGVQAGKQAKQARLAEAVIEFGNRESQDPRKPKVHRTGQ